MLQTTGPCFSCSYVQHLFLKVAEVLFVLLIAAVLTMFVFVTIRSDRSEEEKERDQLRHERHKERERDRRISKAAPDKR